MKAREILAAYAAGDTSPAESAAVERLLAADPAAARELAELRALVDDVRHGAPRPRVEPSWDDMADAVARAIGERGPAPRPSWWQRLTARPLWLGGALAAAAAVLWLAVRSGGDPSAPRPRAAERELRAPEVEDLDDDELDALNEVLPDFAPDPLEPDESDLFAEPDYPSWLDTLSDEELDLLDQSLSES